MSDAKRAPEQAKHKRTPRDSNQVGPTRAPVARFAAQEKALEHCD